MAANDSKIGVQLNNGELVTKDGKAYRRYKLQANKNTSNPIIKDLAAQNSHRVSAKADVPINDSKSNEEKIDNLLDDLYADIDKRMKLWDCLAHTVTSRSYVKELSVLALKRVSIYN
ncbi:hypothetical protein BJX65DRAFT_301939 [Aspergillus insuetus]